jgi:hypothetical protein
MKMTNVQFIDFTQVPNGILLGFDIDFKNPLDENLYIKVNAIVAKGKEKVFQISRNQMAKLCRVSAPTLDKAVERLSKMGLIKTWSQKKEGSKENEVLFWQLLEAFTFQEKEVEKEINNPTKDSLAPLVKNLYNPTKESLESFNTSNTNINTLNTNKATSINFDETINRYMPNKFDAKSLLIINKWLNKLVSKKVTNERIEQLIEFMATRTIDKLEGFMKWLVGYELEKPNELQAEKEEKLKAPKKIIRKEVVPQWLQDKKEGKEPKKVELYDDATWAVMKAEMEEKLKCYK